jgi:hypothetical protein
LELVTTPQHEGPVGGLVPSDGRDYEAEAASQARLLDVEDELHKHFLEMVTTHEKIDESKWRDIRKGWIKTRNYADNRQYGYVSNTNQWVDYPKQPGEINYTKNIVRPQIDMMMMELSRGRTELSFEYIAPESYKGNLIKKVAEARYAAHKRRLFTSTKMDQENLSLLLNGIALRYTYFDWNGQSSVPEFGDKQGEGMEATVCAECGVPVQEASCARCGSEESVVIKAELKGKGVAGYQQKPTGENNWVSVDPLGVTFYLQAPSIQATPYLIWRQSILPSILQSKYKDTAIKQGDSEAMKDKEGADTSTPNTRASTLTVMLTLTLFKRGSTTRFTATGKLQRTRNLETARY